MLGRTEMFIISLSQKFKNLFMHFYAHQKIEWLFNEFLRNFVLFFLEHGPFYAIFKVKILKNLPANRFQHFVTVYVYM